MVENKNFDYTQSHRSMENADIRDDNFNDKPKCVLELSLNKSRLYTTCPRSGHS